MQHPQCRQHHRETSMHIMANKIKPVTNVQRTCTQNFVFLQLEEEVEVFKQDGR
jgi:hypothetical protein